MTTVPSETAPRHDSATTPPLSAVDTGSLSDIATLRAYRTLAEQCTDLPAAVQEMRQAVEAARRAGKPREEAAALLLLGLTSCSKMNRYSHWKR